MDKIGKRTLLNFRNVLFLGSFLISLCFCMLGCKKNDIESKGQDSINSIKHLLLRHPKPIPEDIQERADKAISQWNNKKVDSVPILFYAKVKRQQDTDKIFLVLPFSDEDENILGIGVRERHSCGNTAEILEERYPIFIQKSQPAVSMVLLPIRNRTEGQRKDETAWSLYMRGEGEFSIEKEKTPPIYLPLTYDPNVSTEVFVYDKDGQVSEFIPVEISD